MVASVSPHKKRPRKVLISRGRYVLERYGKSGKAAVTDANTKAGGSAGDYKNGNAGAVIGFTSTGANDWYGGDIVNSKKIDTFFLPEYSYKLVYTSESEAGAGDATLNLYECHSSKVGTAGEVWNPVYTQKNLIPVLFVRTAARAWPSKV